MQATPTPTPELIGAATAEQGNLAVTALQPGDLVGQIRAFAKVITNGGIISVVGWAGFASVVRQAAGQYKFTLSQAPVPGNFIVLANADPSASYDAETSISSLNATAGTFLVAQTIQGVFNDPAFIVVAVIW